MENQYKQNTLRHWYLGEYDWNDEKVLLVYGQFYNRPGIYEVLFHHSIRIHQDTSDVRYFACIDFP